MDLITKDGHKIYGAELNGNFKGMYSYFNEKYFDGSLPDVSVYGCTRITSPGARPYERTFGLTTLAGDTTPDLGIAIFLAEPSAAQFGWQTMVHEMVHIQLRELDHTREFWMTLKTLADRHYLEMLGFPEEYRTASS